MNAVMSFYKNVHDENHYLYEMKYFIWNRVFALLSDILWGLFCLVPAIVLSTITYGLW